MKLKERGITVGDLLLISIIVISTVFVINKYKDSDTEINIYTTPKVIETI